MVIISPIRCARRAVMDSAPGFYNGGWSLHEQAPFRSADMSKKVAEIIVDTFVSASVKHSYGFAGDTLNPIVHHMNEGDIEWPHVRHEEAGAFIAEGEATLSGNLTAVAGSCGPGGLHLNL
jgi:hypothetical protein